MRVLNGEPGLSMTDIARRLGWHTKDQLPNKSRVQKRLRKLESKKLVERDGERLELTDAGQKRLAKIGGLQSKGAAPKSGPISLVKP
jgi:Mn-dependent DtxR family transcriptional regulator